MAIYCVTEDLRYACRSSTGPRRIVSSNLQKPSNGIISRYFEDLRYHETISNPTSNFISQRFRR